MPYIAAGGIAYGGSKLAEKSKDDRVREAGVGLGALALWAATRGKAGDPEVERLALRSTSELLNNLPPDITKGMLQYLSGTRDLLDPTELKDLMNYSRHEESAKALEQAFKNIPVVKDLMSGLRNFIHDNSDQMKFMSQRLIAGKEPPSDEIQRLPMWRQVKAIVEATKQAIPSDVRIYRGEVIEANPDNYDRLLTLRNLKPGDDFHIPDLRSFSDSKEVAEEMFAQRSNKLEPDEKFLLETVGPIKRLNIAPEGFHREEESITFGKFKVESVKHELGPKVGSIAPPPGRASGPIVRIVIRQVGM